jgi:hypothetical protein
MKRRLLFLAFCILVAGLDLPNPFSGRLSARDVPPVVQPIFPDFPSPNEPPLLTGLSLSAFEGGQTSQIVVSEDGRLSFVHMRTGQTTIQLRPLGSPFQDPISFSAFSFGGGPSPDTLFAGPYGPSDVPFTGWSLTSPPRLLGETPDEWIRAGGLRIVTANVDGDRTPELILSSGPRGPGSVAVQYLGRDQMIGFGPFGPDHLGGIFLSAGNLTGDSHDELVFSSEGPGGGVIIGDVVGGTVRLRTEPFFPFGRDFPFGTRTTVGDVTGDGVGELFVSTTDGPPRVMGFSISSGRATKIVDFFAHDQPAAGGVFMAHGYSDGQPFLATTVRNEHPRVYRNSGSLVLSYIDRDLTSLLDDFVADTLGSFTPPR